MSYKKKKTRFSQKIRIDPRQLEWLKSHKGTYRTVAGKLDEVINHYKRNLYDQSLGPTMAD